MTEVGLLPLFERLCEMEIERVITRESALTKIEQRCEPGKYAGGLLDGFTHAHTLAREAEEARRAGRVILGLADAMTRDLPTTTTLEAAYREGWREAIDTAVSYWNALLKRKPQL